MSELSVFILKLLATDVAIGIVFLIGGVGNIQNDNEKWAERCASGVIISFFAAIGLILWFIRS